MSTFKYLFVGAGLSNLAAARCLFDRGERSILILESGSALSSRSCPGISPSKCFFCKKGCSILSGTGGTNALFGNKFCYFPASANILDYFSADTLSNAWHWLDTTLFPWFQSHNNYLSTYQKEWDIKFFESHIIPQADFQRMVLSLAGPLIRENMIHNHAIVAKITKSDDKYLTILKTGLQYFSHSLILGIGRSGSDLTEATCNHLGVSVYNNRPDIGFRIEAQNDLFSNFYHYQEDPKLKKYYSDGVVRTFCAENGGIVVPVEFYNSYFAEGAYGKKQETRNNVALMVRSNTPLSRKELNNWCARINSVHSSLIIAEVDVSGLPHNVAMKKIADKFPELPTSTHNTLMKRLIDILSSTRTPLFRDAPINSKVTIYGPAIDNYWPVPEVAHELRTCAPNFFILGDALGLSRGYVQALTSGAAWAFSQESISIKDLIHAHKDKSICFDLA